MQHFTTAPPAAASGLDLFAAAWLERWLHHGGSFSVNPDGTGSMFARVNADDAPGYQESPADWTEAQRNSRREIDNWVFTGRTRELMQLLELVPGGAEAVKRHVRAFPSFGRPGGVVGVH